jgi:hypothetical protein
MRKAERSPKLLPLRTQHEREQVEVGDERKEQVSRIFQLTIQNMSLGIFHTFFTLYHKSLAYFCSFTLPLGLAYQSNSTTSTPYFVSHSK